MFTYVKLKNYRSFDETIFNLKETKEKIKKIAVIYGENGCGKSNLIRSFYFLNRLMNSFQIEKDGIEIRQVIESSDLKKLPENLYDYIKKIQVENIYTNSRMVDCDENTILEFGFKINDHEGYYRIEFNDKIQSEKLYYYTGKQSGSIFEISKNDDINIKLCPLIFETSKINNEIVDVIRKYWGRHSMLAITYDLLKKVNKEYLDENISPLLFDFHNMILETSVSLREGQDETLVESSKKINFLSNLEKGTVLEKNIGVLKNTENILNDFFVQTYSDIRGVKFETKNVNNQIGYHLYFYKNINGKVRRIPVEQESTGTRQILYVLRSLFGAFCGCTVIIDEVDNGVHDLLLETVIKSMIKYINGQLIITTHNTTLLDYLDPKMVYLINGNYNGQKEIICLSEYNIQDHNSPRLRYMKGLYGGIPFIDNVDYNEIISNLEKKEN